MNPVAELDQTDAAQGGPAGYPDPIGEPEQDAVASGAANGAGPSDGGPELPKVVAEDEDVVEIIMPSAEPRVQSIMTIPADGQEPQVWAEFTQKPLSYFRKMKFFKLLAKGLKDAIDEGGPEAVTDFFGGATSGRTVQDQMQALSSTDFSDASSFMRFVLTVFEQSEDLLEEAYVVWLGVPPGKQELAKAAMRGDIEGVEPLSDEDGWAIMKTFVVQNWAAMQAFFTVHAREVFEVAKAEQRRIAPDAD